MTDEERHQLMFAPMVQSTTLTARRHVSQMATPVTPERPEIQFQKERYEDAVFDRIVRSATAMIWAKEHDKVHVTRFPKDWLEAFKERWAPAWVRDRWPVIYTEESVRITELYPGFQPALPGDQYECVIKTASLTKDCAIPF